MEDKKKQAEKRKKEGENNLNKLGLSLDSDLISIGIIFDNLLKSDLNMAGLNSVNAIFNGFVGVDLNIFSHNMGECCVFLLAPLLDLKYIFNWIYPLIAISRSTLQTALNSRSQNIYYYDWYNNEKGIDDPRIKIINRNTIDNFDLVKIIKIINEDIVRGAKIG
jgi:hypothetical protein